MVVGRGGTKFLLNLETLTAERLPYKGTEIELSGRQPFTLHYKGSFHITFLLAPLIYDFSHLNRCVL